MKREARTLTVKLYGDRKTLLNVKDTIKQHHIIVYESKVMPNDRDSGAHMFLTLLGVAS